MLEPTSDRDPVEMLAEEFRDRLRRGERPDVEEFARRHPEHAATIRDLFPALLMVEELKGAAPVDLTAAGPLPEQSPQRATSRLERLGDYRILREVGRGGMGVVYEAEQESLGRRVALKVLPASAVADARQRKRFEREAKSVARLHHTNIVPVFGVGEQDGTQYFVMQFIAGLGLDQVLAEVVRQRRPAHATAAGEATRSSPQPDVSVVDVARSLVTGLHTAPPDVPSADASGTVAVPRAEPTTTPASAAASDTGRAYWQSVARIGAQVADALDYAAGQGVLHRDIKPSNVLLDAQGNAWIADFGLAKATAEADDLTHTGDIVGTLRYMAPERFEGRSDIRSDVYALGLTLYEMLALRPAFGGSDRNSIIKEVTTREPMPPRALDRSIPRDLETVVLKAIAREPERRYQTAGAMAEDLHRFLADRPVQARRVGPAVRFVRWCRRNPAVASLSATIGILLAAAGVASALAAAHFQELAGTEREARDAAVEARQRAEAARTEVSAVRAAADAARDSEAAQRRQADEARHRAEADRKAAQAQRVRADANFHAARATADAYLNRVTEEQLLSVPGLQALRLKLLASAVQSYEKLLEGRGDDHDLRLALADTHQRASKLYKEIGDNAGYTREHLEATSLYGELMKVAKLNRAARAGMAKALLSGENWAALPLWEQLAREEPANRDFQHGLATALYSRGRLFTEAKNARAALPDYQRALPIDVDLLRRDPDDMATADLLQRMLNNIGVHLDQQGRIDDALALYYRSVARGEASYTRSPQALSYGRALATGYRNIALTEKRLGRPDETLRFLAKRLDHMQRMAQANPAVSELRGQVAAAAIELGTYQRELGHKEDSARSFRFAGAVFAQMPRRTPNDLYNLAGAHAVHAAVIGSGDSTGAGGDAIQARKFAAEAVDALRRAVIAGHRNAVRLKTDKNLEALRERADFKELVTRLETIERAEALRTPTGRLRAQQVVLALRRQFADAHREEEETRAALAQGYLDVGLAQLDLGQGEATRSLAQAIALRQDLVRAHRLSATHRHELTQAYVAIAEHQWNAGRPADASKSWQDALAVLDAAARDGVPQERLALARVSTHGAVADGYARAGLWREAAQYSDKLLDIGRSGAGQTTNPSNDGRYAAAALLWRRAGDRDAYRRACAALVERQGAIADPLSELAIVRAWAVGADSGVDPARMLKLAEKATASSAGWVRFDLALAYYRAGQWQRALTEATNVSRTYAPNGREMIWPLLAMVHHRLGHAGAARFWLQQSRAFWQQHSPGAVDVAAPSVVPPHPLSGRGQWQDWLTLELLLFEAARLIEGAPAVEMADDHLHRAVVRSRLGDDAAMEAELRAAEALRPQSVRPALVRARLLIEAGRDAQAADVVARSAKMTDADAGPWIAYGRFLAERGRQADADRAFAHAAMLTPDELNRFPEAGWWVAGPYAPDHRTAPLPESALDPSRPIPADAATGEVRWQPVRTGSCGAVDLRAIFQADNISAYAMTYVWSPKGQTKSLIIGGNGSLRLWLNGRLVHETAGATDGPWMQDRVPVTLRAGRNLLVAKVSHTVGLHSLCVRIADNPFDRGYALARLTLWKEASAAWTEAARRGMIEHPNTRVYHATFLLAADNTDGYRDYRAGLVERHLQAPDDAYVFLYGAALGPCDQSDADWLLQRAQWIAWNQALNVRVIWGLTLYRAGRFHEARTAFDQIGNFDAEPRGLAGLALTHHRLGNKDEARRYLARARQWYDKATSAALAEPGFRRPWGDAWQYLPQFVVLYREAQTAIEGSAPANDANLQRLQTRAREELKKVNPDAPDYDMALLLEPTVWRHRQARIADHAEHKRWDEAAADIAAAADAYPMNAVRERMAVYRAALRWTEVVASLKRMRPADTNLAAVLHAREFNAKGSGPAGVVGAGNLLKNGSFEQSPFPVNWNFQRFAGQQVPGWRVTRAQVDLMGLEWQAAHGVRSIDLDGGHPGAIAQDFATVPGQRYRVTFDLAGAARGPLALIKRVQVRAAGQSADFAFDTSGGTTTDPGWVGKSWEFTANAASTTLEFVSLEMPSSSNGPFIDNVAVVPVK